MNDKFFSLPKEKQLNIINAATEVFARNEYKKASTDLIAKKAGISKGLLFFYFKNKQELYLYIYEYITTMMKNLAADQEYLKITDFFELLRYFSRKKAEVLKEVPDIMEFAMRAFYSDKEAVSDDLKNINVQMLDMIFEMYLSHVDYSKFREDADPYKLYQMLIWMADGYFHEHQMSRQSWTLEELMAEFDIWMTMLKKTAYKEEYLDECN